jgi:hypothetical protein
MAENLASTTYALQQQTLKSGNIYKIQNCTIVVTMVAWQTHSMVPTSWTLTSELSTSKTKTLEIVKMKLLKIVKMKIN